MKLAVASCFLLSIASAMEHQVAMTPTQKVIQLMDKMKADGVAEKKAEKEQFEKYQDFCYFSLKNKERSVMELTEKISSLEANIEENTASETTLKTELAEHNTRLETATKDKEESTAVRTQEAEDFAVVKKDYEDSIEAIGKAKVVLTKQSHTRKQAESLLQLGLDLHPRKATEALTAFLQGASKQPVAAGYSFQSQGVIDMLDNLQSQFLKEKRDVEMQEQKKINSFDLVSTALAHEIDQQEKHIAKKTGFRNSALQELASDKAALEQAKKDKAADIKYAKDLKAECSQKEIDFNARQKLRGEELEAIQKARDIIASRVSATDKEHMPGRFLQEDAASLANLRSEMRGTDRIQNAVKILEKNAATLGSRTLSLIASQVASNAPEGGTKADDAINKIKGMLTNLLAKLQKQAMDETNQKMYCDKELAANKLTRTSKTDAKDTLTSEIEQLSTSIAKLTNENAQLSADITKTVKEMGEANTLRLADKAKNAKTIKEAEAAKKAVGEALVVLQDFYEGASKATSLVQEDPEKPETFDKPYTGMGGQSGGVMGMLEVIMEDFSRLISETSSAESIAYKEHSKFIEDSRIDKAEKEKTIESNTERITEQSTMLDERQNDLKSTDIELEAANKYYRELHSQCLDSNKAAIEAEEQRKQEIASLEEAKEALE
eukprot:TRINITY_DN10299_c0_g5_i1.p1 TRINITY_DN10299_c0_g5~~TRINITY_DN10299_c0_g5_i1.p1  ORF type:complete len:666 (+),score=220.63 TRINITY_DN10299_c0_g5_i1:85-2082(+)